LCWSLTSPGTRLRRRALVPVRLFESTILVTKPEIAAGEPPLDGSAQGRSPAPAVGVATASAVTRVVDPLKQARHDVRSVARVKCRASRRPWPSWQHVEATQEADEDRGRTQAVNVNQAWTNGTPAGHVGLADTEAVG
jgi:hypothetical protein